MDYFEPDHPSGRKEKWDKEASCSTDNIIPLKTVKRKGQRAKDMRNPQAIPRAMLFPWEGTLVMCCGNRLDAHSPGLRASFAGLEAALP